jgi:hypothetical protein
MELIKDYDIGIHYHPGKANVTSGKRAIGGAFFFLCVAHMECATNATPLVTVYWWRIFHMRHE